MTREQLAAVFNHAILDIDLLHLIARPREIKARKEPSSLKRFNFFTVKKIGRGFLIAEEEPVFSAYGKWLHRSFGDIVVDRQFAVGDVDVQCVPLVAGISDGFSQRTFWQRAHCSMIEPVLQRRQPRD